MIAPLFSECKTFMSKSTRSNLLLEIRSMISCTRPSDHSQLALLRDRSKETTEPNTKSGKHKSQFKIIADKRESLLSNAGNPAGWVNRTTEREEMAVHGSKWRSDAEFLLLFIDFLLDHLDLYFISCDLFSFSHLQAS